MTPKEFEAFFGETSEDMGIDLDDWDDENNLEVEIELMHLEDEFNNQRDNIEDNNETGENQK